jgi:hypothetical protein
MITTKGRSDAVGGDAQPVRDHDLWMIVQCSRLDCSREWGRGNDQRDSVVLTPAGQGELAESPEDVGRLPRILPREPGLCDGARSVHVALVEAVAHHGADAIERAMDLDKGVVERCYPKADVVWRAKIADYARGWWE